MSVRTDNMAVWAVCVMMSFMTSHVYGQASGSALHFTSSTTDIIPSLASDLTLTCALNVTSSSGSIIGRRDTAAATTNSLNQIEFLSSLVVMRGNDHVAAVTEHTAAHALINPGNITVKGHILGGEGSLQLTWKYPTDVQAGEYSCEANGITEVGHNVMLTDNLEVGVRDLTMADLVHHIGEIKQRADQQDAKIATLEQEMASLRHVESGFVDCQGSENWSGRLINVYGGQDRYLEKVVRFQKAFSVAPVVHLSASHWWDHVDAASETGVTNGYYYIDLVSVTKDSFTMRCRTFAPDHIHMSVSWVGVPQ